MNTEIKLAISEMAQRGVDDTIAQCRANGWDEVECLQGMILRDRETIHWANEAIERITKEQAND